MIQNLGEIIIKQLNWRYATKKFDPNKKISAENWQILEEALRLSPSSLGLQPFQFLVIENPEVRKKLTPFSYNQPQIENCSHLVILTCLKLVRLEYIENYLQNIVQTRNIPEEKLSEYKKMMVASMPMLDDIWSSKQAYISMGIFITAASLLEIDVCPMEGFERDKYDEILNLSNSEYTSTAVLAAGYRSENDDYQNLKKVRMEKTKLIKMV